MYYYHPGPVLYLIIHWLVSALALFITAKLVPGMRIKNFPSALVACAIIGFANITIRPILLFLTFPINILTLGLFTFVVNAIVLRLTAYLLRDFAISGWGSAILGAFVLALIGTVLQLALV